MQTIIAVADGMADLPLAQLGGHTPMQAANTPAIDALVPFARLGRVRTIPHGIPPGSDTAFLSILGFDPLCDYTGRAPLEAAALGVPIEADDAFLRINFIAITPDAAWEDADILSHSGGGLTHEEGHELCAAVNADAGCIALMESLGFSLYEGTGYRHILRIRGGAAAKRFETTPPHDVLDQPLRDHLPRGTGIEGLMAFMREASRVLAAHPMNIGRPQPANCAFAWGQGGAPKVRPLGQAFPGLRGTCVTAVPLVHGVCVCRGMERIDVPGATGELDTNYEGKAAATLAALRDGYDLILVHVEAPDEEGHAGRVEGKVEAIRRFDERIVAPIAAAMRAMDTPVQLLIMPDHATPLSTRTHSADPVPFLLWNNQATIEAPGAVYDDVTDLPLVDEGWRLFGEILRG